MKSTDIDEGWAWVVLVAAFGCQLGSSLLSYGSGVFLVGLLAEFHDNVAMTSFVGSAYISVFSLMGIFKFIVKTFTFIFTSSRFVSKRIIYPKNYH